MNCVYYICIMRTPFIIEPKKKTGVLIISTKKTTACHVCNLNILIN